MHYRPYLPLIIRYTSLLSLLLFTYRLSVAQTYPYQQKWEAIEKKEVEGLLKSMQGEVNELYAQAKRDKNSQQKMKALLYQAKIEMLTADSLRQEGALLDQFKREIKEASLIERSILQSLTGEFLHEYYQSNRYPINRRTTIEGREKTADFLTWTEDDFKKEITDLYDASVEDRKILQETPVSDWEFLLDTALQYRELRPTLYDLLAHRAIDYFSMQENEQKRVDFLLQTLLSSHKQDTVKNAYLYNCLQYLSRTEEVPGRIAKLQQLIGKFPKAWYNAELMYQLAKDYQVSLTGQSPIFWRNKATAVKDFEKMKRYADSLLYLCDQAMALYPNTYGAKQLQLMKAELLQPEVSIEMDRVLLPEQAFPVHISHKNAHKLYVKILKCDLAANGFFNNQIELWRDMKNQRDIDSILRAIDLMQEYAIDLKSFDDYQRHATIVRFNPLPAGQYFMLVATNPAFKLDSTAVVLGQHLQVSRYAIASRGEELLLTDRDSGKPVRDKVIKLFTQASNEKDLAVLEEVKTNANGQAFIGKHRKETAFHWYNTWYRVEGDPVFFASHTYYNPPRYVDTTERPQTNIQFFTDRAIYRPGQTVYFKGIVYEEKPDGARRALSGYQTTVRLFDANQAALDEIKLSTNMYGSVFGSFVLPTGKLNGQFRLEGLGAGGQRDFRVEEYKKPSFEISMDTLRATYKLGDTVKTTGKATTYSGAPIVQGKVSYRVLRRSFNPYPNWYRYDHNYADSEQVKAGETRTTSDGTFAISFLTEPAGKQLEDEFRFYRYTVEISVIDVNGEAHENSQAIAVGDKSILLRIPLPAKISIEELDSIPFETTNLNYQAVTAKGNIKLSRLKRPTRVLQNSALGDVDYMLLDSLAFIKLFPHFPYKNEQKKENWPKEALVSDHDFNSAESRHIDIGGDSLEAGTYLLEAYVLDGSDTLRTSQEVELYHKEAKKPLPGEFLQVNADKGFYEPGEEAVIIFSSAIPDARVFISVERNGDIIKQEQIRLSKEVKKVAVPIDKDIKENNLYVHYYLGRYNAAEQGTLTLPIVQKGTDLKITTNTFRDKLQPGEEETWELTIRNANNDGVAAELLAAMYDASLNQFAENSFYFPGPIQYHPSKLPQWNLSGAFGQVGAQQIARRYLYTHILIPVYENLNRFGFSFLNHAWQQVAYVNKLSERYKMGVQSNRVMDFNAVGEPFDTKQNLDEVVVVGYGISNKKALSGAVTGVQVRGAATLEEAPLYVVDGEIVEQIDAIDPDDIDRMQKLTGGEAIALYGAQAARGVVVINTKSAANKAALQQVKARKNLKETAFFYPDLHTDTAGNIKLRFTSPESLTEWKFMAFAHTPSLATGYMEKPLKTSKGLMAVPNAPRFLREGDEIALSAKIVNMSEADLKGSAKLMLFDAYTMQSVDTLFELVDSTLPFMVEKGENRSLFWRLKVPSSLEAIVYRIVARAGDFSDGEEAALPILPNRMLLTETLPIYAKEGQVKHVELRPLAVANAHTQHERLSLELTTDPMWYAIQSLPYLQEYPYACSEQLFAKLYATLVAKKLIDTSPKIKHLFDEWNRKGRVQSKLETRQELKSLLLEETPWVSEAADEEVRMKRLALLFDVNNLRNQWQSVYQQFVARQLPSGAFPWFEGGPANELITTHILAGFGHLRKLGADFASVGDSTYLQVVQRLVVYLDRAIEKGLDKPESSLSVSRYNLSRYLYARSFFLTSHPIKEWVQGEVFKRLSANLEKNLNTNLQERALLTLVYSRFGEEEKAKKIWTSLKDYAVTNDEKGMYWKENQRGWDGWQNPIETQVLLIEAASEMADMESVEQMKLWLIGNKQTNHWGSTKATTEAIYALLSAGENNLSVEQQVQVKVGKQSLNLSPTSNGAGYVKTAWSRSEIKPEMAQIVIEKKSEGPIWGALYWQYFESLRAIKAAITGVQIEKRLYLKRNAKEGVVLTAINQEEPIKVGDLVRVRLIIRADRDISFIHLKDMRASGFEPVNVLSNYKWQGGLGYYESTKDAATNFFIDKLRKGTYVFEYDLRANNAGVFANGVATLQSMYAPEMSARTEGITVEIKE
ncbi:alpha-2-macroglobulin [Olivibacter sp. XZL3]|uniref:alpha-2-macroglobulin family protein n=1 Tax=Olivibacter sp. XZL3 TaxID=1735116 RepID=UPI001066D5E1|nr:alpha-2-macroglobulin family protein [Olivibacter sp. XZL3]